MPLKKPLLSLFSALGHSHATYVIALDEVQELAPVSGQLLTLLANIFASYNNVRFIFTGSQIGLIKYLIEPPDSHSPLFGRPPAQIHLKPFKRETSEAFLLAGLKECNSTLAKDQLDQVIARLDGIAGWLTMYGNFHGIRKMSHLTALEETIEQGKKISQNELNNFLKGRNKKNYLAVLKTLSYSDPSGSSWSELKSGSELKLRRRVNNKTLTSVIDSLVESEILEHSNGKYTMIDPLLREGL